MGAQYIPLAGYIGTYLSTYWARPGVLSASGTCLPRGPGMIKRGMARDLPVSARFIHSLVLILQRRQDPVSWVAAAARPSACLRLPGCRVPPKPDGKHPGIQERPVGQLLARHLLLQNAATGLTGARHECTRGHEACAAEEEGPRPWLLDAGADNPLSALAVATANLFARPQRLGGRRMARKSYVPRNCLRVAASAGARPWISRALGNGPSSQSRRVSGHSHGGFSLAPFPALGGRVEEKTAPGGASRLALAFWDGPAAMARWPPIGARAGRAGGWSCS